MTDGLVVDGVVSGYGRTVVVRGVSLEVRPGEIVALLGRNGAGKTTLLSTIVGLIRPLRGTVWLDGRPLPPGDLMAAVRRGIGLVPESRSLFTQLTVRDNLIVAGARGRREIERALGHFPELRRLLDRRAGLLSGGERQMLAIARALIRRPQVLLVDELSLGLAPVVCTRLVEILREVSQADGVSVLLVEQHLHLALAVASRAYVVRRGEISYSGHVAELGDDLDRVQAAYLPGSPDLVDQHEPVSGPKVRPGPQPTGGQR